jgi:hypothetical protein
LGAHRIPLETGLLIPSVLLGPSAREIDLLFFPYTAERATKSDADVEGHRARSCLSALDDSLSDFSILVDQLLYPLINFEKALASLVDLFVKAFTPSIKILRRISSLR